MRGMCRFLLLGLVVTLSAAAVALSGAPAAAQTGEAKAQGDQRGNPPKSYTDQPATKTPKSMKGAKIVQHIGDKLPMDTPLITSEGERVTLGHYFENNDDTPVILNFGYYQCQTLCSVIMQKLAQTVNELGWVPGDRYKILTISIDPGETPTQAKAAKNRMLAMLSDMDRPGAGWHFHTAPAKPIKQLTDAAGFMYGYNPETEQYAHKAVLIMASPDGKITEYLLNLQQTPKELRDAIQAANTGQLSEKKETGWVQSCLRYIKDTGFVSEAQGIMKLGGVLTILAIVVAIGVALLREALRRRHGPDPAGRPDRFDATAGDES